MIRYWSSWKSLTVLALSLSSALLLALPVRAAERIRFTYGLLGLSVSVDDLETFAEGGPLKGNVRTLLSRLSPEAQDSLRGVLQARYDVDPVLVSQFSYTTSGEQLLDEAGALLQTTSGQNGARAIRAALVLAAADPEGLSLLNFIRQFPTDIRVDVGQALAIARDFSAYIDETQTVMADLKQETEAIAQSEPPVEFSQLPDVRQPGPFSVTMQTLTIQDERRDRTFAADLYWPESHRPESHRPESLDSESVPETSSSENSVLGEPAAELVEPASIPLVVVSNGLGARRDRFDELAEFLSSYGFAVAILDHPGSDRQRLQEFYQGLHAENFAAREFVDRPQDISSMLDELERMNASAFDHRLNLERVGIYGYSFGGTTAFSLAGATMDVEHLRHDCATRQAVFNISLLYQCRALELTEPIPPLRDERIQAVQVFVPFGRSLFGPQGMAQVEVPVFWEATDQDILTPLVIEQLPAFGWLDAPQKYLAVTEGLPHARLTLDVMNRLTNRAIAWEDVKPINEMYHNVLSLIFFKVYLAEDEAFRPYLRARYAQELTQEPYTLNLVQSITFTFEDGS